MHVLCHIINWNPAEFQIVLLQTRNLISTRINWNCSFNWVFISVNGNSVFSRGKLGCFLQFKLEFCFFLVEIRISSPERHWSVVNV